MPRKPKSHDGNAVESIRGMWEVAYVSQFLRLFGSKLGLSHLSTQILEESLCDNKSLVVADIFARLLRYLTDKNSIRIDNFEVNLRQLLHEKATLLVNPFLGHGKLPFRQLTPEDKVGVLKWLVDHVHQEKEEDLAEFLDDNFNADDLRGICAGEDAFKNVYWYLDDLRLYRENFWKKPNKKDWECVCASLADWNSFLKQFRKTTNLQERQLFSYLNYQLFPIIEGQLESLGEEKERVSTHWLSSGRILDREKAEVGDMLEKITCNGSTGATTLVNHNGSNSSEVQPEKDTVSVKVEDKANHCEATEGLTTDAIVSRPPINETKVMSSGAACACRNAGCINCAPDACGNNGIVSNGIGSVGGLIANNGSGNQSRESTQDGSLQSYSDNPSDSSVSSNKENLPAVTVGALPVKTETVVPPSAMTNLVGAATIPPVPVTTVSIQPLPSNMLTKSTSSMESQYMQQQSQIFVFSTGLANKAAESVLSEQYPSIIAFHCGQPGTKKFLEKHPLKIQQFNRQSPAVWLNNLAQMKQQGNRQFKVGGMNPMGGGPPMMMNHQFPGNSCGPACTGPCNPQANNAPCGPNGMWMPMNAGGMGMPGPQIRPQEGGFGPNWPHQQPGGPNGMGSSMNPRFPQGHDVRGPGPPQHNMSPHGGPGGSFPGDFIGNNGKMGPMSAAALANAANQSTLQGVKIPDENLTPQQRQHREEQLAMIRKMQQLLFPEQQQHPHQHPHPHHHPQHNLDGHPGGPNQNHMMSGSPVCGNMGPNGPQRPGGGEMCHQGHMDPMYHHQHCMGDHEHHPHDGPMPPCSPAGMGPHFQGNVGPGGNGEWVKMNQFYDHNRRKNFPGPPTPGTAQAQASPQQPLSHPPPQLTPGQPGTPQQPSTPLTSTSQQHINSPSPTVGMSPGARMQGPPPPYHQGGSRAGGPMPSPHPASPNTAGSLSLPSPHMQSGLPSPADPGRPFPHPTTPGNRLSHPSPGGGAAGGGGSLHSTPLNSPKPAGANLSGSGGNLARTPTTPIPTSTPTGIPSATISSSHAAPSPSPTSTTMTGGPGSVGSRKRVSTPINHGSNLSEGEFGTISQDGSMFSSRPSHLCGQSPMSTPKHPGSVGDSMTSDNGKEPSLMPVPSPQQIQYLNTFEGQELTIQKQPNTSLRESDLLSPGMGTGRMDLPHPTPPFVGPETSHSPFVPHPGSCNPMGGPCPDGMHPRFPSMDGGPHQRFHFEGGQRFSSPNHGMPNSERFMNPGMNPGSGGAMSGMDGNMPRFPGHSVHSPGFPTPNMPGSPMDGASQRFAMGPGTPDSMQRFRGPNPHLQGGEMSRFPNPHMAGQQHSEGMLSHPSFGVDQMPPQQYSNPGQPRMSPFEQQQSNMGPHSHIHSLQKMALPFEPGQPGKMPEAMSPISPNNMGMQSGRTSNNPASQRLSHFDPIASMAAMSETSVGPPVSSSPHSHSNPCVSMSSMQIANNNPNSNPPTNVVNFHTGLQSMHNAHQAMNSPGPGGPMPGQMPFGMGHQMGHNVGPGPQTVNNTYVNATMSIQQLNIQNAPTSSYNPNMHPQSMSPHSAMMQQQHQSMVGGMGANTVSSQATPNHPIMHSGVTAKSGSVRGAMPPQSQHPQSQHQQQQHFPGQPISGQRPNNPMGPGLMPRTPGVVNSPGYNSPNIQVKPNAPNTIQYLPARPQSSGVVGNRPPSLDFLQRYASPLTNLDSKVPTHNLQYFPNAGPNGANPAAGGMPMNPAMMGQAQSMMGSAQRPMGGPMMRGPMMGQPQGMVPGHQMYPGGGNPQNADPNMFNRTQGPNMMGPGGPGGQMHGMFPGKQLPLSPTSGMAPDTTQALPSSMGHTLNYKQSPFYGPTTADPNYAVQFHNFQQQLYATNTRGGGAGGNNPQNSISPGPNFFGGK